jgi:hypothetical protein
VPVEAAPDPDAAPDPAAPVPCVAVP